MPGLLLCSVTANTKDFGSFNASSILATTTIIIKFHIMKMFKTYKKVKDIFVKPKIRFFCCPWRSSPLFPVWRRGNTIWLSRKIRWGSFINDYKVYKPENIYIKIGDKYSLTNHKLPKKYVWRSDIRKKLKKFGLGWIKPSYELPMWLTFRFFDHDIYWDTGEYGDINVYGSPSCSLILFGYSFNWILVPPEADVKGFLNFYWEFILSYLENKNLLDASKSIGKWEYKDGYFYGAALDYLKEPYKTQLKNVREDKNIFGKSIQNRYNNLLRQAKNS